MEVVQTLADQRITSVPSTVKFDCELSRAVPVTWCRNGRPLTADAHCLIAADGAHHTLTIVKAVENDEGEYSITAKNVTATATLLIEGTSIL